MPLYYYCRKCGESYSKEDHDKSMFCRACGSLLSPRLSAGVSYSELKIRQLQQSPVPMPKPEDAKDREALMRAAQSLRQRIADTKEFEVVSEAEAKPEELRGLAFGSWIWNSEYDNALRFEMKLLDKYRDKGLNEAIQGKVVSNEQGECYAISASCVSGFKKATHEESVGHIISDLKIIPGIGPARELELRKQGYATIEELENHPFWGDHARKFMKLLKDSDIVSLQEWLSRRLPKSHPLAHYLAGLCDDGDFAMIDIETMGLSERPIILLGIAKPANKRICVNQYLLRDIQDEPAAIWALVSELEPDSSLITYNGRSFDIPYIQQRLAYYGLYAPMEHPHFDVLHFTRRALRSKLNDCRLETVEKYLGLKRELDIPGALVPHFYETYLKTGNVGPLVAIVEHNRQDLLTLGSLFSRLYEEWGQ